MIVKLLQQMNSQFGRWSQVLVIMLFCMVVHGRVWAANALSEESHWTHPVASEVMTLRTIVNGDFMKLPVIDLAGNSSLEISFDWLGTEEPRLTYTVIHCDRNWEPSSLSQLDYLDGFLPVRVTDVEMSFNTFTQYYHCRVAFPNEELSLLVSGNYAVIFSLEEDEDEVVAEACFSVSEQLAFVEGKVSGNTDVDFRMNHQQLDLAVAWSNAQLPYVNPSGDLYLVVTQNNRRDTRREIDRPLRIEANRAYYEHNRDLIWEAGNTWRRFEMTSERYAGIGIERIRYHAPDYFAYLWQDKARSQYLYDQDQKGRYLVNAVRVEDAATEADYFRAVFTLEPCVIPPSGCGIYLIGDFTYGARDERFRMTFDGETGVYRQEVLLKMGHYNYMYAIGQDEPALDNDTRPMHLGPIEGDFYETPNEYEVSVYYRPHGSRYDRLLGVAIL